MGKSWLGKIVTQTAKDRMQQLPHMPSPFGDHQMLEIEAPVMERIADYCNLMLEFETAGQNREVFMDVCSILTVCDKNQRQLRVANKYLKNATEAYIHYAETLVES